MHTIYDFATLAIFAGLAVLFLQRSTEPTVRDRITDYLPPAVGCAAANYLGNNGHSVIAIIVIFAVVGYIFAVLKPFAPLPPS